MINAYERSDIVHIMKMNRLALSDSDTAHLEFGGRVNDADYRITILVVEGLPAIVVKRGGATIFNETMKSVDDLKIFLEERLYKFFQA